MKLENLIVYSPEVREALDTNKPIVALESTIISHGFAYPDNLDTALTCEKVIREQGAVPATIGIREGKILIGMTEEQIEYFAQNRSIPKASRRDVASLLAFKMDGATTVTTTMWFASLAGIKFFATGGIGGVHRGAETTMDISADLKEFNKSDVNVICAGAKSLLDLALTREVLETEGVTVLGYQSEDFPAFYVRTSGLKVDYRIDSPEAIAEIVRAKEAINSTTGLLITNPIPLEDEMDPTFVDNLINNAVKESEIKGITGKEVTPYLLSVLGEESEGKTVTANKALVFNNARLAAEISIAYNNLAR